MDLFTYFPILLPLLLFLGIRFARTSLLLLVFWISILGLLTIQLQIRGEIFGNYFHYQHALALSIYLVSGLCSLMLLLFSRPLLSSFWLYSRQIFAFFTSIFAFFLLINAFINAYFIAHRLPHTSLLQVAFLKKPYYCNHPYVFYKILSPGEMYYLCPNHYGVLPSIGKVSHPPLYVLEQLPVKIQHAFDNFPKKTQLLT